MLSRWRCQISTAITTAVAKTKADPVSYQAVAGSTADAERDPTDTLSDRHTISTKTNRHRTTPLGESNTRQPAAVATPLPPPLMRVKRGYKWPRNAERQTRQMHGSLQIPQDDVNHIARAVGTAPFEESPTNVRMPRAVPK